MPRQAVTAASRLCPAPGLPVLTFLPTVDKLTSVHALSGNKSLFPQPIVVRVSEHHAGKRSTSAWVMKDLPHHTLDVAMALSIVQGPKLRCSLTMFDMCSKHTSFPLTLTANHPAHLGKGGGEGRGGRGITANNTQLARNYVKRSTQKNAFQLSTTTRTERPVQSIGVGGLGHTL